MRKLRIDVYGGYDGEKRPDPDHKYSWRQHDFETPQDFVERVCQYIIDMAEQLDEDNFDEGTDDDAD